MQSRVVSIWVALKSYDPAEVIWTPRMKACTLQRSPEARGQESEEPLSYGRRPVICPPPPTHVEDVWKPRRKAHGRLCPPKLQDPEGNGRIPRAWCLLLTLLLGKSTTHMAPRAGTPKVSKSDFYMLPHTSQHPHICQLPLLPV
jgi:hypothetical protein